MPLRLAQNLRLLRREVRPTLALALPIMAGMVSQMLIGLADTAMIGHVGVVPLAAASFVNAVAHLPLVFGLGLLSSIAVLTSQAYGARRPEDAGEILRHGLVVSVIVGLLAALSMFALHPLLPRLGQPPEVVAEAGVYLFLFGASLFPALVAHGCKQFAEALKHPWVPTFVMLGGVLLNVFLNWILIYGHWGVPAMGIKGAGWATVIARLVMALALLVYVLRAPALRAFQPARWRAVLSRARFLNLFTLGWPVAGQHFCEVSAFAFAAIMMGWISADAIAAHQIAITCAALSFMFVLGLGAAACIRVGHAYGAGQFNRMRRIGLGAVGLAAGIMAMFGVTFMLAGRPIASWFIASPSVVELTAQLLIVAAIFQIADGVQVTSISALRGLADVRAPALIAVLAYWVLAVPLGSLLAFRAHWGAVGIWTGLAIGLGVAALGLAWRFHRQTRRAAGLHRIVPPVSAVFPEHGALP
jgi:MATE family multidrug resistance protein